MNKDGLARYTVVTCEVTGHADYGLLIRETASRRQGFVDRADIADAPLRADAWPAIGEQFRGVVLGHTRDGRIRVHASRMYVNLIESLADPEQALQEWVRLKREGAVDAEVRADFFSSPNAQALMRWALGRPSQSRDREIAVMLLAAAPAHLKESLDDDQGDYNQ